MAVSNLSFSAAVDAWCKKTEDRMTRIWKQSTQDVINEAQKTVGAGGRMRVDTGFLRASGRASTSEMASINPSARPQEGQRYSFDEGEVATVIASAELGMTIYFGYTASYAGYREYGANGQPPDAFVRTAAAQWQPIVSKNIARAKQIAGQS